MRTAIAIALLLLAPAWRLAVTTPDSRFYVRQEKEETPDRTLLSWEKRQSRSDTKDGRQPRAEDVAALAEKIGAEKAESFDHTVSLKEYDCKRHYLRFREVHYYNSKGAELYTGEPVKDFSAEWGKPVPGTASEQLFELACEKPVDMQD